MNEEKDFTSNNSPNKKSKIKYFRIGYEILISILFLLFFFVSGSAQSNYENAKTNYDSLKKDYNKLEKEFSALNSEYVSYQEKMKPYEEMSIAQAETEKIKAEQEKKALEEAEQAKKAEEEAEQARKAEEEKIAKEKAEKLSQNSFSDGHYKVGTDIPAGEYIIIGSGYFCVSSDSNDENIIFNDNFKNNSIITLNEGEYFRLSRGTAYPFDMYTQANALDTSLSGGMYKIGTHLPSGEYCLQADGNGYYCIYSDSRHDDIVNNENFTGSTYVTVSDGQYLLLSNCHIAN